MSTECDHDKIDPTTVDLGNRLFAYLDAMFDTGVDSTANIFNVIIRYISDARRANMDPRETVDVIDRTLRQYEVD